MIKKINQPAMIQAAGQPPAEISREKIADDPRRAVTGFRLEEDRREQQGEDGVAAGPQGNCQLVDCLNYFHDVPGVLSWR